MPDPKPTFTTTTDTVTQPDLIEEKVVLQWDEDGGGWVVDYTRTTARSSRTTERAVSKPLPTLAAAEAAAAHEWPQQPVRVRGDDRARAAREAISAEATPPSDKPVKPIAGPVDG